MAHPLREFRLKNGMSQEKLGQMLGYHRLTIMKWESGRRKPSLSELPGISEKTGIPARDLRPDLAKILERT
jgi:transcriptional regulator with XRE-family HTH domain